MKIDIKKIIVLIILIIVLVGIYFLVSNLSNNKPNISAIKEYDIILYGPSEITLYKGEEYEEMGYYATLNHKEFVTGDVIVTNNIDINKEGSYIVTYKIGNALKFRNIKVIENPNNNINDIKLELIGNEVVEISLNDSYTDSGCLAYDKNNNDISNRIVVDNQVNTSVADTYYVIYTIVENNKEKSIRRTVIVHEKEETINDLNLSVSYDTSYTNKDIEVNITASGKDFSYIKVPNGNQIAVSKTTYTIKENGNYYFYVYDNNGNYKVKNINVTNIDKSPPIAYCDAKRSSDKTEITVTASDNLGISNYLYYTNTSKITSNFSSFTIPEHLDIVKVGVLDKAGNVSDITCNVKSSNIEMHFIAGISDDDAILIRTDDKVIMIDGGQYGAKDKIVSYLKDLGITKIDVMIGSHVHWNHVQAQAAILENFEVDKIYYSVDIMNCVSKKKCKSDDVKYIKNKIKTKGYTPIKLAAKDYLEIGDMKLYFIGPNSKLTTYENANSLVFILQFGNNKFMLTGDTPGDRMSASKFKTNAKALGLEDISIDVLKWPHHGYENLSDSFFKATKPKYAIIPNCCYCSSKYPSSHNKTLMKKYGIKYYQVCSGKNIVLTSDGENIDIKTKQKAADYAR